MLPGGYTVCIYLVCMFVLCTFGGLALLVLFCFVWVCCFAAEFAGFGYLVGSFCSWFCCLYWTCGYLSLLRVLLLIDWLFLRFDGFKFLFMLICV